MNDQESPDDDNVGTQDEPVMDIPHASNSEKLNGIIRQTIHDLGAGYPVTQMTAIVLERSTDSGLNYSQEHVSTAVATAVRGVEPS